MVQNAGNIKNVSLENLNPMLVFGKKLNDDLLKLEAEVAHSEIKLYSQKCEAIYKRIEPKLFALNEISKKLPVDDSVKFENARKAYVSIKRKYDNIINYDTTSYPFVKKGDSWTYKHRIEVE